MKGNSGAPPCMLHSWPDRPAKHTWAECLENPANQKKPPAKREQAYYAHDTRRLASDGSSDDGYRTEPASDDHEASQHSKASCRSYSSRDSGVDNYAIAFMAPRKRAKLNPSARKKNEHIAASDESDGGGNNGSNKKGKLRDPIYLSDSN